MFFHWYCGWNLAGEGLPPLLINLVAASSFRQQIALVVLRRLSRVRRRAQGGEASASSCSILPTMCWCFCWFYLGKPRQRTSDMSTWCTPLIDYTISCLHLFDRNYQRTAIQDCRPWIVSDWSSVHRTVQLMVRGKIEGAHCLFIQSVHARIV